MGSTLAHASTRSKQRVNCVTEGEPTNRRCFGNTTKLVWGCSGRAIDTELHALAQKNLLAFFAKVYGENHGNEMTNATCGMPQFKALPVFAQFAKAVFSCLISSAVVEALFNKYGNARSKSRSLLDDDTVAAILMTQELEDIVGNVDEPFTALLKLRDEALTDETDW